MTDTPAATPAEAPAALAPSEGASISQTAAPWWEKDARLTPEHRAHMTAKGLLTDDPVAALARAVDMHRHAETRLGAPAGSLIPKPKDGQALADWAREHREVFGLPEGPDGYKIARPADLPKGMPWDDRFEADARRIAHEQGVPPAALEAFVGLYAQRAAAVFGEADAQAAAATQEMMGELTRAWGAQAPAKIAAAQGAAQAVATKAGLKPEEMATVTGLLAGKLGDAQALRLFAAIGEMMGEDSMVQARSSGGFGGTPESAHAELARMNAPGSEWYEAVKRNDRAAMNRLMPARDALIRLAAGSR